MFVAIISPRGNSLFFYPLGLGDSAIVEARAYTPQLFPIHAVNELHDALARAFLKTDENGDVVPITLIDNAVVAQQFKDLKALELGDEAISNDQDLFADLCADGAPQLLAKLPYEPNNPGSEANSLTLAEQDSLAGRHFTMGQVFQQIQKFYRQGKMDSESKIPPFAVVFPDTASLVPLGTDAVQAYETGINKLALESGVWTDHRRPLTASDIEEIADKGNIIQESDTFMESYAPGTRIVRFVGDLPFFLSGPADLEDTTAYLLRSQLVSAGNPGYKQYDGAVRQMAGKYLGGNMPEISRMPVQLALVRYPVGTDGPSIFRPLDPSPTVNGAEDEDDQVAMANCADLHRSINRRVLDTVFHNAGITDADDRADLLNRTVWSSRADLCVDGDCDDHGMAVIARFHRASAATNAESRTGEVQAEITGADRSLAMEQTLGALAQTALLKSPGTSAVFLTGITGSGAEAAALIEGQGENLIVGQIGGPLGEMATKLTVFGIEVLSMFAGAEAIVYIEFLALMLKMALFGILMITPVAFLIGLLVPGYARGIIILTVAVPTVLALVPMTLTLVNVMLHLVWNQFASPDDTMRAIFLCAASGIYTSVVGITLWLMFKIGDPASAIANMAKLDSAAGGIADKGVDATKKVAMAGATVAALPAIGAAGASLIGAAKIGSKAIAEQGLMGAVMNKKTWEDLARRSGREGLEVFTIGAGEGLAKLPYVGPIFEEGANAWHQAGQKQDDLRRINRSRGEKGEPELTWGQLEERMKINKDVKNRVDFLYGAGESDAAHSLLIDNWDHLSKDDRVNLIRRVNKDNGASKANPQTRATDYKNESIEIDNLTDYVTGASSINAWAACGGAKGGEPIGYDEAFREIAHAMRQASRADMGYAKPFTLNVDADGVVEGGFKLDTKTPEAELIGDIVATKMGTEFGNKVDMEGDLWTVRTGSYQAETPRLGPTSSGPQNPDDPGRNPNPGGNDPTPPRGQGPGTTGGDPLANRNLGGSGPSGFEGTGDRDLSRSIDRLVTALNRHTETTSRTAMLEQGRQNRTASFSQTRIDTPEPPKKRKTKRIDRGE